MYQLYRDFNLVKKGPKNSGMGKPPPLFGQCPKENVFFSMISSLSISLPVFCVMEGWVGLKFWAWGGIAALESEEMSLAVSEPSRSRVDGEARGLPSNKQLMETDSFVQLCCNGSFNFPPVWALYNANAVLLNSTWKVHFVHFGVFNAFSHSGLHVQCSAARGQDW